MDHHQHENPDEKNEVLRELLEQLGDLLRHFDYKALWIQDGPNELRQRVAAEALRSIGSFTPQGHLVPSLRAWLSGIANHVYAAMAREAYRALEPLEHAVVEDAKANGLSPSRTFAKDQALASLRECLHKLNERDRSILVGKYIDRRTQRELADFFDMSEHQVENHLRMGKRRLRECWGSSGALQFNQGGR